MTYGWLDFFTDPILRGPTIGSMLMCAAASLIGVVVFVRRKSLVGETLSHAAYPGLIVGAFFCSLFPSLGEEVLFYLLLLGAFLSSSVAAVLLHRLQNRFLVKSDAALCLVLSSFLGVGVLLASRMQFIHPLWYRQVQTFLYGQAATMTDFYIWVYGALFLLILGCVVAFYQTIRMVYFDGAFANSLGFSVKTFERFFFFLLILAVVVAMKSVGVVLLSGMFIAPALSARKLTHHLSKMFFFASCMGAASGFLGNYFSVKLTHWIPGGRFSFPTGPMIVLFSSCICLVILFAKSSKVKKISPICHLENLLKMLHGMEGRTLASISQYRQKNRWGTWLLLRKAISLNWVVKQEKEYVLSSLGEERAKQIVSAHDYWGETFLQRGQGEKKVYKSVEEIELFQKGGV